MRLSDLKPLLFLSCHLDFPLECTLIKAELGEREGIWRGWRVSSQEGLSGKEIDT